jgi:A/G-specific adenine glycosylase
LARTRSIQDLLPVKAEKAVRPLKRGAAFVARDASGAVLLVKRPANGLLGGMLQPPLGPWAKEFPPPDEAMHQAPFSAKWKKRAGIVRHGFTHFELEIEVYVADIGRRPSHIHFCHSRPSDAPASRGEGNPGGGTTEKLDHLGPLPSAREERASAGMTMWVAEPELSTAALPTVMRKIISHALDGGGPLFAHASAARRR